MKTFKRVIIGGAVTVGIGTGSFFGGKVHEQTLTPSAKIERQGPRYIAYDPDSFGKKKATVEMFGKTKQANGFTAYEVNDPNDKDIPDGFKIVEDRKYSIDFVTGCSEKPEPVDPRPSDPASVPWGVDKVNAIEAQAITKAEKIIVCVTDTGSDINHPDLKEMLVGGTNHVPGVGSWQDDQGHGTHVAGTIAAQLNTIDVVGVSQAKIFTAKVLDSGGSGYGSWIADGIISCVDNGAKIVSMSLGSPAIYGPDPLIKGAVQYALNSGVYVVAAAGNDGKGVGYPAALNGVIAVSASTTGDKLASFSSRGPEIDIMAPGVGIPSTQLGGGVVSFSGTSMATPHVSGALALALAVGKKELKAVDVGLPKEHQGIGRLDALKTVTE